MPPKDKTEQRDGQPDPAWRSRLAHLRLWLLLAVVLAADLASKQIVFAWLGEPPDASAPAVRPPEPYTLIPGVLEFQTAYNRGAALGILQGWGVLFVAIGAVAFVVLLVLFARSRAGQWFFHMGVGLVMAGALGNIYDRVVFGQVRDFVHITARFNDIWSSWPDKPIWPWIWNIADASLIIGVSAILLSQLRSPHPDAAGKQEKET